VAKSLRLFCVQVVKMLIRGASSARIAKVAHVKATSQLRFSTREFSRQSANNSARPMAGKGKDNQASRSVYGGLPNESEFLDEGPFLSDATELIGEPLVRPEHRARPGVNFYKQDFAVSVFSSEMEIPAEAVQSDPPLADVLMSAKAQSEPKANGGKVKDKDEREMHRGYQDLGALQERRAEAEGDTWKEHQDETPARQKLDPAMLKAQEMMPGAAKDTTSKGKRMAEKVSRAHTKNSDRLNEYSKKSDKGAGLNKTDKEVKNVEHKAAEARYKSAARDADNFDAAFKMLVGVDQPDNVASKATPNSPASGSAQKASAEKGKAGGVLGAVKEKAGEVLATARNKVEAWAVADELGTASASGEAECANLRDVSENKGESERAAQDIPSVDLLRGAKETISHAAHCERGGEQSCPGRPEGA